MIRFSCPHCGSEYEIEDEFVGVHAVCDKCETKMEIPRGVENEIVVAQVVVADAGEAKVDAGPLTGGLTIDFEKPTGGLAVNREVSSCAPATGKISPRQRRLLADWKSMMRHFSNFPFIRVKSCVGNPPEKYVMVYNIKGIERVDGDRVVYRNYHEVEIKLPGTYPRTPPLCRVLTPIFHPNIEPAVICIGDHWTAAERLCNLVVRIGEMIAYQAHNVKSPLDGEAAMWTDLHLDMLPIDSSDLTPPDL